MRKERLKSPRARLFVALDLPEPVREAIVRWQQAELGDRALRPLRPEALHITLVFLGYQPEKAIERIGRLALEVAEAAPAIELEPEPVAVPRSRPRLFALSSRSPQAEAIQAKVSNRLERAGFYEPEKRPFWPHVTVARVRGERHGSNRPVVKRPPGPLPDELLEPFVGVRIALYRSDLRPQGAEHVSLAHKQLRGSGRGELDG